MSDGNNNNSSSSRGIGFSGLLTVGFVMLKLTDVIDWSWIWVLAPLWISLGIGLVLLIIFAIVAAICS